MADENGVVDPKENVDLNKSDVFNKYFLEFLKDNGWNQKEVRSKFVALINSMVLSSKSNTSHQYTLVAFMENAINTLNMEIQKLELNKNDKIVTIDPDDVNDEEEEIVQQQESKKMRIKENQSDPVVEALVQKFVQAMDEVDQNLNIKAFGNSIGKILKSEYGTHNYRDFLSSLKTTLEESIQVNPSRDYKTEYSTIVENLRKELKECGLKKEEIDSIVRVTLDPDKIQYDGDKELLLEKCKKRASDAVEYVRSEKKRPLREEEPTEEEKPEPEKDAPKEKVEPKSEPEQNDDSEKEEPKDDNVDVKISNFQTFIRNYMVDELGWTLDDTESIINSTISFIKKGKDDVGAQSKVVSELGIQLNKVKSQYPNLDISVSESSQSSIALDNLSDYAKLYNSWNSSNTTTFVSQFIEMINMGKSVKAQKSILKAINNTKKNI